MIEPPESERDAFINAKIVDAGGEPIEGAYADFDAYCDRWEAEHPGETIDYGVEFGQWLANKTGSRVLGRQLGSGRTTVAEPEEEHGG